MSDPKELETRKTWVLPSNAKAEKTASRIGNIVQGKYRIDGLLGVGGVAAVYAATHRNGYRAAIKFLLPRHSDDAHIRRLFTREAYVANRVGHPGAVPVLDDDVDEVGCPFLIMPLLEGETLRRCWELAGRRLPVDTVVVLMSDALDVLASAHAKAIVHRDIKPDNLFVTARGELRVLDFGIARRIDGDGAGTSTAQLIGTPGFMPPEQALSKRQEIGPASDCWAIGATMFTLLSGELVHKADSAGAQLVAAATRRARSLAEANSHLPAPIVRFVDKALAFEPAQRWPSALEMREALRDALREALGEPFASTEMRVRRALSDALWPATEKMENGPKESALARVSNEPTTIEEHDVALRGGVAGRARKKSRRRLWAALACIVAIASAGTFSIANLARAARHVGSASPAAPQIEASSAGSQPSEAAVAGALSDAPRRDAVAHFDAAVQLWLDMSHQEAIARFGTATEADPSFARAHLYYVLAEPWLNDQARLHYRSALDHRTSLGETDMRILEALGPSMTDPPDLAETERRLTALLESAHDVLLADAVSSRRLRLDRARDALEVLSKVKGTTRSPAFGPYLRAEVALEEYRAEDAKRELQRCVSRSPSAASCLRAMTALLAYDGLCPEAEAASRRWIAAWPSDPEAYRWLANSLYGRTQSIESARVALERKWALQGSAESPARAADAAYLALLSGDIEGGRRALDEWERLAASSSDGRALGLPGEIRLDLEYDMSPPEQVRALTKRYIDRSAAWVASPLQDFRVNTARMLVRTGAMSEQEAERLRDEWLANIPSALYASGARRWFNFYAEWAVTPRLAADAMSHLPRERPFFGLLGCDSGCQAIIGETFLLAGDVSGAIPHLERSANACNLEDPVPAMRARDLLGHAMESMGNTREACTYYGRIITRWSRVRESHLVQDAMSRFARLGCAADRK